MKARVSNGCPRRGPLVLGFLLVAFGWSLAAPTAEAVFIPPGPEPKGPPTIEAPAPGKRLPLRVDARALPPGARAHFPAYDGDRFVATLPARQVKELGAAEVRDKVVLPILKALGFRGGAKALALPPAAGARQPVANLKGLAESVAFEYASHPKLGRPETQKMIDAFLGKRPPDREIDRALEMGEGMSFAQFVADIERREIHYPFRQMVGDIPVEHTLVLASRWEGQTVTSVRGTVFDRYRIANRRLVSRAAAPGAAIKALGRVPGIDRVTSDRPERVPALVLLPYGTDATGTWWLRYAYRMILRAVWEGWEGPFRLWLDAETASILKLEPGFDEVSASGRVYNRDPGNAATTSTTSSSFEVDPASGGLYTLTLSGVMNRVDYQGNGYDSLDVSIGETTGGSSATFANFDQSPISNGDTALCDLGGNKAFPQAHVFSALYRYHKTVLFQGISIPFPTTPWNVKVGAATPWGLCNAGFSFPDFVFGVCEGYPNAACPNYVGGTDFNLLYPAHDRTILGHEMGHAVMRHLAEQRCDELFPGMNLDDCPVRVGWRRLHDLADAWAAHFESTNCIAGWFAKNVGGLDQSLYCARHTEDSFVPRFHTVDDHFPERRLTSVGSDPEGKKRAHSDGQIAAAALWQVRLGMRSKCRPSGVPQFGVRFQRALRDGGWLGTPPAATDTGIYQLLYDLAVEMARQWAESGSPGGPPAFAHNGAHTTNKVTAGFGRVGVFLVPLSCLNTVGGNCGDAVIDIDDNDTSDDVDINGVTHPEVDYLALGGPAPTFHVWTGPRYRLDASTEAHTLTNPAPCNAEFQVQVSTDPGFAAGSTVTSQWVSVNTNPTTSGTTQCYGTWTPIASQWAILQAGGAGSRIYYRATTRDANAGNVRVSTSPGHGLWTVPPPYAVITANGQPDY